MSLVVVVLCYWQRGSCPTEVIVLLSYRVVAPGVFIPQVVVLEPRLFDVYVIQSGVWYPVYGTLHSSNPLLLLKKL